MFLRQTMEITETDFFKEYMLVEQFASSSNANWFMNFWSNLKFGGIFFWPFNGKDVVEFARYFRCTPKNEYVNKMFFTGVTSWIWTELLFIHRVDFGGITIYLYVPLVWTKTQTYAHEPNIFV